MMFLFDFFRSFLPMHNPIGFGASDFILLALALLFVAFSWLRRRLGPAARKLADCTAWSMAALAALPVVLRLALLPRFPAPIPSGADDFSYILLADTFRHFRLANPMHVLHRFFEAVFVIQDPSYSSIYPPAQGVVLALGHALTGSYWTGVLLATAALSAGCYWMLRGWTTPIWSLLGGLLAALEFGPLNRWTNLYWGGGVSAAAGCLIFGALPRFKREPTTRNAALLGAGLGLQLLTRPFEFAIAAAAVAIYLLPSARKIAKALPLVAVTLLPAVSLMLAQNKAVTGSWTTLPYMLSRYQYGVPTTFTFQPKPIPHNALTAEQQLDYRAQSVVHDDAGGYFARLWQRVGFYRFFFFPALLLALPALVPALREFRFLWAAGTLLFAALAENFYPYFYPHYVAVFTCLFVLITITALERAGPTVSRAVVYLALAHFVFWYSLYCGNQTMLYAAGRYDTADFINYGDPEGRMAIQQQLERIPGRKLVFVRYGPVHMFHEWIHNAADIDDAEVVWAADLGEQEDQLLCDSYPTRSVWLVEPDAVPPRLVRYQ
jgi:hypothetical protein